MAILSKKKKDDVRRFFVIKPQSLILSLTLFSNELLLLPLLCGFSKPRTPGSLAGRKLVPAPLLFTILAAPVSSVLVATAKKVFG